MGGARGSCGGGRGEARSGGFALRDVDTSRRRNAVLAATMDAPTSAVVASRRIIVEQPLTDGTVEIKRSSPRRPGR